MPELCPRERGEEQRSLADLVPPRVRAPRVVVLGVQVVEREIRRCLGDVDLTVAGEVPQQVLAQQHLVSGLVGQRLDLTAVL